MSDIVIKQISINDHEYRQVWQLREDVLRKPIGLSLVGEDLSRDAEDVIIAAITNGEVIGCLMLHPVDADKVQLRQMAVAVSIQGSGIGRQLVQAAEEAARAGGAAAIVLHARQAAAGFYERLGYTAYGDLFTEVGIPHLMMEKQLIEP